MQMSVPVDFRSRYLFSITLQNVKALLTIGGWTGSIYWSSSVATVQNRWSRGVRGHSIGQQV